MAQVYDTPKRSLTFYIETSDTGESHGPNFLKRRKIENWRRIGTMRFDAAVASYNGDHVFHPNHVPWRKDRNDPEAMWFFARYLLTAKGPLAAWKFVNEHAFPTSAPKELQSHWCSPRYRSHSSSLDFQASGNCRFTKD